MGCRHHRRRSRHRKSSSSRGQQYFGITLTQQFRLRPVHRMVWHSQCFLEQSSRHARRAHRFGNVGNAAAVGSPAVYHRQSVTPAVTSHPVQCTLTQSRPMLTPLQISHHPQSGTPARMRHSSIRAQPVFRNSLQRRLDWPVAPVVTRHFP
jgi:hypothetical protein